MTEERFPAASHAPFSIVAISALLWSQGVVWAALGALSLFLSRWLPASGLIAGVFFGFVVLSWVLAVLLPRRGSERTRSWVIAEEIFIAFLGMAIIGTWVFALDAFYLFAPIGLFVVGGIFMAACAVVGLLSGSARDYCLQRAALSGWVDGA